MGKDITFDVGGDCFLQLFRIFSSFSTRLITSDFDYERIWPVFWQSRKGYTSIID